MIQDLIDLVEDFEFQHDLEAKLYIDGLDIVKYIFQFYEKETKETSLIYISENIRKAKSFNTKTTFSDSEDSNKSLIVHMSGNKSRDITDNKIGFSIESDSDKISFELSFSDRKTEKNQIEHKIDGLLSIGKPHRLNIIFNMEGVKTLNKDNLEVSSYYDGVLNFETPDTVLFPLGIRFSVESNTEYEKEIEMPETSRQETFDISVAEEKDYDELMLEIQENFNMLQTKIVDLYMDSSNNTQ